jgi:hypothetical protein
MRAASSLALLVSLVGLMLVSGCSAGSTGPVSQDFAGSPNAGVSTSPTPAAITQSPTWPPPQLTTPGQGFFAAQVLVTDATGVPLDGVPVTFSVGSGGQAGFGGNKAPTWAATTVRGGYASAPYLLAGPNSGTFTLSATISTPNGPVSTSGRYATFL